MNCLLALVNFQITQETHRKSSVSLEYVICKIIAHSVLCCCLCKRKQTQGLICGYSVPVCLACGWSHCVLLIHFAAAVGKMFLNAVQRSVGSRYDGGWCDSRWGFLSAKATTLLLLGPNKASPLYLRKQGSTIFQEKVMGKTVEPKPDLTWSWTCEATNESWCSLDFQGTAHIDHRNNTALG